MTTELANLKITPIQEIGVIRTGTLIASFNEIKEAVGFDDNVTEIADFSKVKASWGFKDAQGRKAFIWLYKVYSFKKKEQLSWSIDGSKELLRELFPEKIKQ